ncbi:hypothetical protein ACFFWD_41615 [Bradyrhizobium erythrophlei]|uniref:hypothetical protein n=1 Tax=Bradyrhizobium erythrophlei TaxID=1437360 RepID=UPI0035EABEF6
MIGFDVKKLQFSLSFGCCPTAPGGEPVGPRDLLERRDVDRAPTRGVHVFGRGLRSDRDQPKPKPKHCESARQACRHGLQTLCFEGKCVEGDMTQTS